MTRENLNKEIENLNDLNGKPLAYFVSYNECSNIVHNAKGKFEYFHLELDRMEQSKSCIQGVLPFNTLVIYYNAYATIFRENPYWDCVDDDDMESHFIYSIGYVGTNGEWKYLTGKVKIEK